MKEYQKTVDKGDGNFTIDGLMTVMISSWKSLEEEEEAILSAFRVFDKENTGRIDADELRHIFVTLGDALTQEEVPFFSRISSTSRTCNDLFFCR